MIVASHRHEEGSPRRSAPVAEAPAPALAWLPLSILGICEIVGVLAVVKSYRIALTTLTSEAEFAWFWAGMILIVLPAVWVISRHATSEALRYALLVLLGILTYVPKLLRSPSGPVFHDEFAHWRQTYEILSTGKLFQPAQIVTIISEYPGLHSATAALVNLTGLTIWQAGVLLILLLHISLLIGIAALAQAVGLNSRGAALAAVIYSFNSSFLYFDTQFAYESMAMPLVVWALTAFVRSVRTAPGPGRSAWCWVTVILSAGTIMTHHLSAIDLSLVMLGFAALLSLPWLARGEDWRRTSRTAWGLAGFTTLATVAWIAFVAPATVPYLTPYLGSGLSQLFQIVAGSSSGRKLFSASLSPWWEHDAALLVTAIALLVAVVGIFLIRDRIKKRLLLPGSQRSLVFALMLLGLVYFPSTLLIFSASGAEGARRSWAITWIGLAVFTGPAVVWLIEWSASRANVLGRITSRTTLAALLAVALVGGTGAGLSATYRFPGPFLYGSEARSDNAELDAMSQWFLDRFGPGNHVVTDRYTGLIMAASGLQDMASPSAGFPVWNLYLDKPGQTVGPALLLKDLEVSHYLYLVVDARMAREVPYVGVYFEGSEPTDFVTANGQSIFKGRLGKFDSLRWMSKVYQSNDYSVYRMNLPIENSSYQVKPVKFSGKLSVSG